LTSPGGSPLGRYRSEIVKSVRDETTKVHKAVQELATQLAVSDAKAEMFELKAIHPERPRRQAPAHPVS
jgi:hypothetical protein